MQHRFSGFTLIEMLLSFALSAIFLTGVLSFAWNVADLNLRRERMQMVFIEANVLSERILFLIRNAESVSSIQSDKIELAKIGESGVITIFLRDGTLFLDDGTSEEALSGSGIFIRNVSFEDYRAESGRFESVGYEITLEAETTATTDSVFLSTRTIRGTGMVRSSPSF